MSRKRRREKGGDAARDCLPSSLPFPAWTGAAAAAWAALCFWAYYRRGVSYTLSTWMDWAGLFPSLGARLFSGLGRDLLFVAGMACLCERVGAVLLRILPGRPEAEAFVRTALGSGAVSLLLLLLGLAGWWTPPVLKGLYFAGLILAAGLRLGRRSRGRPEPGPAPKKISLGLFEWAALFLIGAGFLMNLLASVIPEIFYDSLVYHLALPRLYLFRGGVVPTPENVYSGLPLGLQMFFGWSLALSDENLAALAHAAFGAGAAWGLWSWCRRYCSPRAGITAVLLFYVCPISIYAGWHCGADLGAAFYVLAAFHAFCRCFDGTSEEERRGWNVALGLLVGFAMGVKYNVWPLGAAFLALHLAFSLREGRGAAGSLGAAVTAALALSPWLLKNLWFFGNPLYPFLHEHLGGVRPVDWRGFLNAAGSRDLGAVFGSWGGLKDFLLIPWNFSMADRPTDDWPGPAFIFLAAWAALFKWSSFPDGSRRKVFAALPVLAVCAYLAWAASSDIVRYALGAIPLFSLLIAVALEYGELPPWAGRLGRVIAIFSCAFGFQTAYRLGVINGQWKHLREGSGKADFLRLQRMSYGLPYYSAMEFIAKSVPEDAKILFLGESRAYYSPRDFIAATLYDTNPFWRAAGEAKSAGELHARVRDMGATHVFLSARQLLYRSASPAIMPRDLVRSEVFQDFWARSLDLLFEDREDGGTDPRWLTVYALRETPREDASFGPRNPALEILKFLERNEISDGSIR